jgi:hypothetical protein
MLAAAQLVSELRRGVACEPATVAPNLSALGDEVEVMTRRESVRVFAFARACSALTDCCAVRGRRVRAGLTLKVSERVPAPAAWLEFELGGRRWCCRSRSSECRATGVLPWRSRFPIRRRGVTFSRSSSNRALAQRRSTSASRRLPMSFRGHQTSLGHDLGPARRRSRPHPVTFACPLLFRRA